MSLTSATSDRNESDHRVDRKHRRAFDGHERSRLPRGDVRYGIALGDDDTERLAQGFDARLRMA
jgi:hypothetical protein